MHHSFFAAALGGIGLIASGCAHLRSSVIDASTASNELTTKRTRIASHLDNPRGMLVDDNGRILLALAGTGSGNSGRIVSLHDADGDDRFEVDATILDNQPSANAINVVRRDEVFGVAAIARGNTQVLATIAFFGGPSEILRVGGGDVAPWGLVHGNLNSIAYAPVHDAWFAVSSTSDEILRLRPERGADRVVKLAPLSGGQDPVPGYLRWDATGARLLVSLFSGSTAGEEGGAGTELRRGAGAVVAVDPATGSVESIVAGLTTPTDLALDACGRLYVLEFCDGFADPAAALEELAEVSHGGFRRFTGRLLRVDLQRASTVVLADGLDTPTNLALGRSTVLVSGGMGTPGRKIPSPTGAVPLEGYIDRITVDGCP